MPYAENESNMMGGERTHFFGTEKQVEQTQFF